MDSARVLVVGDSGVGKTTLVQRLCRLPPAAGEPLPPDPQWTVGAEVSVMAMTDRAVGVRSASPATSSCASGGLIEFVDVGGHRNHELSRGVFYHK